MGKQWISDVIGEEFKTWGVNNEKKLVVLECPTGSGKTYFVINHLLRYCQERNKRILYLCNREMLKRQIISEISNKSDADELFAHIDVSLYQSFSQYIKYCNEIYREYGPYIGEAIISSARQGKESVIYTIPTDAIGYMTHVQFLTPYVSMYGEYCSVINNGQPSYPAGNELGAGLPSNIGSIFPIKGEYGKGVYPIVSSDNRALIYEIHFSINSTYEKLKEKYRLLNLSSYDYIIYDEAHYLVQDATFNFRAYDMYRLIMSGIFNNNVNVLISATLSEVAPLIFLTSNANIFDECSNVIPDNPLIGHYTIPTKPSKIIPHTFCSYSQLVEEILKTGNEKWLIFVDTKKNGDKLNDMITDAYKGISQPLNENGDIVAPSKFICRRGRVNEQISDIAANEKFSDVKCLIATSILDNGVSIHDDQLKHIAVITWDETELVQMVGRKRLKDNEKVNVYIMDRHYETIYKYFRLRIMPRCFAINEFLKALYDKNGKLLPRNINNDTNKFLVIAKYCNSNYRYNKLNGIIRFTPNGYDVNLIAKYKYDQMINTYSYYAEEYEQGRSSFAKHQFEVLGVNIDCPIENSNTTGIRVLLDSYVGMNLCYKELKTLKIKLNEFIININELSDFCFKNTRTTNSTEATNLWLLGAGFRYQIRSKINDGHTKKKVYWVEKLDEDAYNNEYKKATEELCSVNDHDNEIN